MIKKLFLDLEGTLIKSWKNNDLIPENIEMIKSFIKNNNIKKALIFSLAVETDEDRIFFNENLKSKLENALEIELLTLTFSEVYLTIIDSNNLDISVESLKRIFIFNQKEEPFIQFIQSLKNVKDVEYVLFDDIVENKDILLRYNNVKITLNKI